MYIYICLFTYAPSACFPGGSAGGQLFLWNGWDVAAAQALSLARGNISVD